jgi:hypothetical protein
MRDRGEVAWREMAVITGGQFVFLTYESAAEGENGRHPYPSAETRSPAGSVK